MFQRIPPKFLEEKVRIAINKKIRGAELNNSDQYYLRKIEKECEKKVKELKYYKLLRSILKR
ncbi:MAG: hypothetical protein BAJALOKI2v1_310025 [Promethearchaeota archaeon]|nr:MAG: hypothetical protein BAJALOKI2v1_310025 [Candidatus Lokiarchaeota archaeon]